MGYRSWFELTIEDAEIKPMAEAAIREFREMSEGANYALDENGDGSEEAKWYEWKEDLRAISNKWPRLKFILSGIGEDSEDRWKCYAKGGKLQHCQAEIVYPEYDEEELT